MGGAIFGFQKGLFLGLLEVVFSSRKLEYKVIDYAKFISVFRM